MNCDYHMHSNNSKDCKVPMIEMCRSAVEVGLNEICFTEHLDLSIDGSISRIDTTAYMDDIAEARLMFPRLTIKVGVELGDIIATRDKAREVLDRLPLDFLLLSKHEVDAGDPYFPEYYEGRTREEAYLLYLTGVLETVETFGPFSSLAHLGYVSKFAPYEPSLRPLRHKDAADIIDQILLKVISIGAALEVNTSTLHATGQPIPSDCIIGRFWELGGEFITIGSDAHLPQNVGRGFATTLEIVKNSGIEYIATYDKLVPKLHKIR